jgi:high-affinity nickel-transport protein
MLLGLLASAFALGVRHGIDFDHLAAISDITGAETTTRRSIGMSTVYALAHGAVVLLLGGVAVVAGDVVPESLDAVMGRVAGVTLIVMGLYVLTGLLRRGATFRVRSRWSLVLEALAAVRRRWRGDGAVVEFEHDHPHDHLRPHGHDHGQGGRSDGEHRAAVVVGHGHPHRHVGTLPVSGYRWPAVAGIGLLHGVGAETPTQVLLFLTAAGAGGAAQGLPVLAVFVVGLLLANTGVAVATTMGRDVVPTWAFAIVASAFSLVVGTLLLAGS